MGLIILLNIYYIFNDKLNFNLRLNAPKPHSFTDLPLQSFVAGGPSDSPERIADEINDLASSVPRAEVLKQEAEHKAENIAGVEETWKNTIEQEKSCIQENIDSEVSENNRDLLKIYYSINKDRINPIFILLLLIMCLAIYTLSSKYLF